MLGVVRRTSAVVAVLILVVTGVLAVLAWQANERSEERILDRQLAQVGTLLTSQASVIQVQLADMAQVAMNTQGNPEVFARWASGELTATGQSLSLWRVADGQAERIVVQGVAPRMPQGGAEALTRVEPTGRLTVLGILPGEPDRWAYALMPSEDSDLLVYGETPLNEDRRLPETPDSPVAGLDLAVYLGTDVDDAHLLLSTVPAPIGGDTRRLTVPFADTSLTLVGRPAANPAGDLAAMLPWIVLVVGGALAVAGGATVEYVSRRRADAERLAAENQRLYREQRGIAGTLQLALLPEVPELDGLDAAARYIAGEDELDVGGDWYDVIPRGPGRCVFAVGDISGRGLPAATTMAALRFALRAYLAQGDDIATALAKLRDLLDISDDHQFATVLLGEIDASSGRISLVSAGHFAPLLVAEGRARFLECPVAPPVGVPAGEPAPATEVRVSGPATLLAFTDGLIERRGEVIDSGLDRLHRTVCTGDSRALPAVLDDVLRSLADDGGRDDTVLLGLRWTPQPTAGAETGPASGSAPAEADRPVTGIAGRIAGRLTGRTAFRRSS